ncbi:MAG: sugar kinase [Myxococcales bacterium]|nr:sugar kinase [Myxococcales bacterium]
MFGPSANQKLLVVGSVAFDDIDGPFGWHRDQLGGSASFIARSAAYFTGQASVVAVVGEAFPQAHLDSLAAAGVDVSGIEKKAGDTFHWVGRYSSDLASRETLDTRLGVFADFAPKLHPQHIDAQLVFLGNIHPALQLEVVRQVKQPRFVAADSMNFWISGQREQLVALLGKVHALLINDEEARQLAGEHNLRKAASAILGMGPSSVIIKRGDAGALLFHRDGTFAMPALVLDDVKDPTGAGDSFAGGFMGYLAYTGKDDLATMRRAMVVGSVMASFAVQQFSVAGLVGLNAEAVRSRVHQFSELMRFDGVEL